MSLSSLPVSPAHLRCILPFPQQSQIFPQGPCPVQASYVTQRQLGFLKLYSFEKKSNTFVVCSYICLYNSF